MKYSEDANEELREIRRLLRAQGSATRAKKLGEFFKTGKGEYGEGDVFLGVPVPAVRRLAGLLDDVSEPVFRTLLESTFHEERFLALVALVRQFERGDETRRREIYALYMAHAEFINNWDLVDVSAAQIVGGYLAARSRAVLEDLAKHPSVWQRRIAIIATFRFIREGDFNTTFRIGKMLLKDPYHLIHKATGWMLREVGNRDRDAEERFLINHYRVMPRTMLRYAIERFPTPLRLAYLKGEI